MSKTTKGEDAGPEIEKHAKQEISEAELEQVSAAVGDLGNDWLVGGTGVDAAASSRDMILKGKKILQN